jgi:hypothetical protein
MQPRLKAHVAHRTPGRLRLKIPAARDNSAFFAALQDKLRDAEGIRNVTVSPAAASLVILHDRGVDPLAACRNMPALAIAPCAVHTPAVRSDRAVGNVGIGGEAVMLLVKLLPFAFARHPLAQLAEVLAEPVLRVVVQALTNPRSERLPHAVRGPEDEVIPLAA